MTKATLPLLRLYRWSFGCVAMRMLSGVSLLGLLYGLPVAASWQTPLSELERDQAVSVALAESDNGLADSTVVNQRRTRGQTRSHPLGTQILLTELRESKNTPAQASRYFEVFLFDYNLGSTLLRTVDVNQMSLVSTVVVDSVHLPLTEVEIQYARSLVLQDEQVKESVIRELAVLETDSVFSITDLQARLSIWVPAANKVSKSNCDRRRCALVSLFTTSDYSLSVEPVVNLSTAEVSIDLIQ